MADITTEKKRTYRYSVYIGVLMASMPVATYVSVPIYNHGGKWAVWWATVGYIDQIKIHNNLLNKFSINYSLTAVSIVYMHFFVKESRGKSKPNEEEYEKCNASDLQEKDGQVNQPPENDSDNEDASQKDKTRVKGKMYEMCETSDPQEKDSPADQPSEEEFSFKAVYKSIIRDILCSFRTVFKPRSGYKRTCLLMLYGIMCVRMFFSGNLL